MHKIKSSFLIAIIICSMIMASCLNTFAAKTNDDDFAQYCNRFSILAVISSITFIGWYLSLPESEPPIEAPDPMPDFCQIESNTDKLTFFGEIKVTKDDRIIQDPNEDFIKEYFAIDIIDDTTDYHSKKNGRVAIGNITKTSKFAVTYLNSTIPNSQFYAWPDEGNEMQEIKDLVLKLPVTEKAFMVNMKLHRIDCNTIANEVKKDEVNVVLVLELADADNIISSGFRFCASNHNKEPFLGAIKIIEDVSAINGVRAIVQDPKRKCKKPKFQFNGNALPTKTGITKGLSLLSKEGESGILNSGPYLSLPKGTYQVQINLVGSFSKTDTNLGSWEIYSFRLKETIKTGDIIKIANQDLIIETNFPVSHEFSEAAFEIRTYSNGKGIIELNSIIIEEL